MTNGDRIRAMTDEEMAKIFIGKCPGGREKCDGFCGLCWLNWLRSPANDGGNEK